MLDKIKSLLTGLLIKLSVWYTFLSKEIRSKSKVNIIKRFVLVSKGFFTYRLIPCDFNKWKYSDYISDLEIIKLSYVNHPYSKLLRNKLVFSNYFRNYFNTPRTFFLITRKLIKSVDTEFNEEGFNGFLNVLVKFGKLIMKPNFGSRGKAIYLLECKGKRFFVNKKEYSESELKKFVASSKGFIIAEFIEQSDFTKSFSPLSTNTLRINTFFDSSKNKVLIKQPYFRMGTSKSAPTDNTSQGGIFALVDTESGILDEAIEVITWGSIKLVKNHPETNVQIYGNVLPQWNKIREQISDTCRVISPEIKAVGWDIIITNDDFYVIEGNNGPELGQQALEHPLARDEEVLNFLKQVKIR